ncbi:MAG: glycosyltransferase [Bacteroidota bacterium]
MRILQLIDSLAIGGAEKMAVNYANGLSEKIEFSGLIATRQEGGLKEQLKYKVNYFFLNKKGAIDIPAIFRLRNYCKQNQIDFVHAHSTSFFTAFLLKLIYFKVKIIWHDHKGARSNESLRRNIPLWFCSFLFTGIIAVNHSLEKWHIKNLCRKDNLYLANFTLFDSSDQELTFLKGEKDKRILCLANLRHPKNHNFLLDIAIIIKKKKPHWSFHLVGNDLNDFYSKELKEKIKNNDLSQNVYIYGAKKDIPHIIQQSSICVLTSSFEGLPVALLEYGMFKKSVVSTAVGEIPLILNNNENGFVVSSNNTEQFVESLILLIENEDLRVKFGENLYKIIIENHSKDIVLKKYLDWINKFQ